MRQISLQNRRGVADIESAKIVFLAAYFLADGLPGRYPTPATLPGVAVS